MNYVMPYKIGSRSAGALAGSLSVRKSRGVKIFRPFTKVVNWGKGDIKVRGRNLSILNKPEAIRAASDKVTSLRVMRAAGVATIDFTSDRSVVWGWLDDGATVYGRRLTRAHSGRGIEILTDGMSVPSLPLYTKGITKAHEFRVHVMLGGVIDFSKKRRRDGGEANPLIKNLDNGWVFCRTGVVLPDCVRDQATKAVRALGLDFGAVDVLYKERENQAFVLEVNTAPGLEGTTLERYSARIRQWLSTGR